MSIMYVGPTISGTVRKNQIFTYNPTDVVEKACGTSPLARHMFVGMDNITEVKRELARPGSFLNITYKKIEQTGGNRPWQTTNME